MLGKLGPHNKCQSQLMEEPRPEGEAVGLLVRHILITFILQVPLSLNVYHLIELEEYDRSIR